MVQEEKLELLAEAMDLDAEDLDVNANLKNMEEWDSLSELSFLSILQAKFRNNVTPQDVKNIVTVKDALNLME